CWPRAARSCSTTATGLFPTSARTRQRPGTPRGRNSALLRSRTANELSACQPAGPLQPLLRDVAMSAFDLARADRQSFGQGLAVVQVVGASAEIAMAGSHGRMLVV